MTQNNLIADEMKLAGNSAPIIYFKFYLILVDIKYFPKSVTCVQNNSSYFVLKRTFMHQSFIFTFHKFNDIITIFKIFS
jgi:hypothetical protein